MKSCLVSILTSLISFGLPLLRKCTPCPESDSASGIECPRPPGMIDYDLALLFQPMLMIGISIGVDFYVIFPEWMLTVLLIILFVGKNQVPFILLSLIKFFCVDFSWKPF
ncbi:hypothetical protein VIGAN_07090100 [Vigna angularis var. angularis]|uniref:Uncharacterized protein n=1 Tax=Vigna angularis var. angularis TaxID=157739 RepID=A0A0S3SH90_PHAAN|nr:hypothetical protein VIGAN_07090100 [Vigna angularis var. angularis]